MTLRSTLPRALAVLAAAAMLAACGSAAPAPYLPASQAIPPALVPDSSPTLYVADAYGKRVEKIAPNGAVSKIGSGWVQPWGVAVDGAGNVYVADDWGNKVVKITPKGKATEIAPGSFTSPAGVAVDGKGNVYVAAYVFAWSANAIVKVAPDGTLSRIGKSLKMQQPRAVAVDGKGNVYVDDPHWTNVQVVAPNGKVSKVGSGFYFPTGIAVDASYTVYVVNGRGDLYTVTASGKQARFAPGYSGQPVGIAVDRARNVYVADTLYRSIRKISPNGKTIVNVGQGLAGAYGVAVAQ
jgi:trimeric autotransporter adhesin